VLAVAAWLPVAPAWALGFDDIAQRAKALAAKPYVSPAAKLPKELAALSYDQ
jgi:glucans biosynthesis protein